MFRSSNVYAQDAKTCRSRGSDVFGAKPPRKRINPLQGRNFSVV
jgi:hypothetical protein